MFLEVNRDKVDSLSRSYNDNIRSSAFFSLKLELDKTYQAIFDHQHLYSTQFIENHCGSLASLLVLNRRFGERKILTENEDFEYFVMVDSCLSTKYPDNKHLAELKKRLQNWNDERKIYEMLEKRLTVGNKIPDIELQEPSGKTTRLHSFSGRPVIVYFWASWNEESRKANKILKELLTKRAKSKPEVYAVGLESYKELWIDAINNDEIQDWTHVTDFLHVKSSAKSLFNIPDKLPYFFYLDKDLIIRYKGNDFEALMSELNRQIQ
jgi:thiol-disulfide isomerase/thioredoxin